MFNHVQFAVGLHWHLALGADAPFAPSLSCLLISTLERYFIADPAGPSHWQCARLGVRFIPPIMHTYNSHLPFTPTPFRFIPLAHADLHGRDGGGQEWRRSVESERACEQDGHTSCERRGVERKHSAKPEDARLPFVPRPRTRVAVPASRGEQDNR